MTLVPPFTGPGRFNRHPVEKYVRKRKPMLRTAPPHIRWTLRVGIPCLATVVLLAVLIFIIVVPSLEENILSNKKETLRRVTEAGWSILQHYEELEKSGLLTREEAQKRAIAHIRTMRYGPEMKDYSWINDMHPNMVMHPYRSDLNGTDISDFKDPNGKRLFVAFVEEVERHGEGYVNYIWQWKDDPTRLEPKLSYVKGFKPWGWIIGTGMYLYDVRAETTAITRHLVQSCSAILIVVTILSLIVATFSLSTEKTRERAETKFHALFNSTFQFIALLKPDGTIIEVNRTALDSVNTKRSDVIGKYFPDTPWWNTSPEHRKLITDAITAASQNRFVRFERQLQLANGKTINIDTSLKPLTNDAGKVTQILAEGRDITDRIKAETELARHRDHLAELVEEQTRELRESQVRFRDVALCSADWIWELNQNEQYVFVSDGVEHILEYNSDELLGHTPFDYMPDQDSNHYNQNFKESIKDHRQFFDLEVWSISKTGKKVCLLTTGKPLFNDEGEFQGYRGVTKDITEKKIAEAKLLATQEELVEASRRAGMSEIATGVLHNVGNVLNSINVSANLVAEQIRKSKVSKLQQAGQLVNDYSDDLADFITNHPQGKHFIPYIIEISQHLAKEQEFVLDSLTSLQDNIEHVKQIVRMQQTYARISGTKEYVSLANVIEDALSMRSSSFSRYNIEVTRKYDDLPDVLTDKHKLMQILVNLVGNAKQAVADRKDLDLQQGRITIRLSQPDENNLSIIVSDNGVGILQKNIERIFSHGFTTKEGGHGFGLHSAALAAAELGGTLTAHSDGENKGAEFELILPLHPVKEHIKS